MAAVAGALDDAPVMHGDGRVDQVAAQRPEPRQRAILVRAGEPAVTDDIRDQDRRDLPGLAHSEPPPLARVALKTGGIRQSLSADLHQRMERQANFRSI